MTELMVLPSDKKGIEQVFIEGQDIDSTIEKIREEAKNLPVDMTVRKNREEVASFAYKVARSKTAVDKAGAALSAEYKEIPKKIDANRRVYKDAFESLQAEVRQPLTEWESAEADRVERHKHNVKMLNDYMLTDDYATSEQLESMLQSLSNTIINDCFEEFETDAHRAKQESHDFLTAKLDARLKHESEQAQKDREAQIARDAAEQARKEADQAALVEREKAQRERIAAEMAIKQAERDLELAEQIRIAQENKAKLDAIAAEKRAAEQADAARQAEIDRQASEAKRIEDERLKREADTKHKGAINRQALADLVEHADITEDQAKLVIKCIAKRLIANVTINY